MIDQGVYLQFPRLADQQGIRHFISKRAGGVSRPPYDSLNMGFGTKDREEHVRENRAILAHSLTIAPENLVVGKQVHGNHIAIVTESDRSRGAFSYESALDTTDAMVTATPNLCLMVLLADCVPIMFYDPSRNVVGAAHAGWRGTVQEIGGKVIQTMEETFGCRPSDIQAAIGPSIGPCCYEVGPEVASKVAPDLIDADRRLNLWEANRRQLLVAGLRAENIEMAKVCTKCNADQFFSERHTPGTGRFGAGITLKG